MLNSSNILSIRLGKEFSQMKIYISQDILRSVGLEVLANIVANVWQPLLKKYYFYLVETKDFKQQNWK